MKPINLPLFLKERLYRDDEARLVLFLAQAAKEIAQLINSGEGIVGKTGSENSSGDVQIALDVESNKIIENYLRKSGVVRIYASEELEEEVKIDGTGELAVAFDPLDGSSIVDANLAVGSIFGIYRSDHFVGLSGNDQIGSLIVIYGPALMLMFTLRNGVHSFIYSGNEFVLMHENVRLEEDGGIFAPGNLGAAAIEGGYLDLVDHWLRNGYKLRYSGGMVPDVYHIFVKGGGIFCYPGYVKSPLGKLRLLFECAPVALLAEQAGGVAYAAKFERVLDVELEILAQKSPIFVGSKNEVARAMSFVFP